MRIVNVSLGAGCDGRCWRQVIDFPGRNVRGGRRNRVVLAPRPWRLSGPPVRVWQRWQQRPLTGESTYKP